MSLQLSRRNFLKRAITSASLAPMMSPLGQLAFANSASKLKVIFAVIPDGFAVDAFAGHNNGLWFPDVSTRESSQFALNEMSSRLGEHANQALFLRGLLLGSGTGGHNGWKTVLRDSNSSSTSIDVLLGNALQGTKPALKRIYSGPHAMVGAAWNISYAENSMLLPEDNPYKLFDAAYGDFQSTSGGPSASVSDNTHVFDPVKEDIRQLRNVLGIEERTKLDTHLGAIEEVISDIKNTLPPSSSCDATSANPQADMAIHSADYRDQVTRAHANILASTMSCGMSRVGTFQIGRSADPVVIKSVSTTRNPHDCAHRYGDVNEWKNSRFWYMEHVKYLLDRLAVYPDPDTPGDTLLDHTLLVLTSEMADGAPEHMQDLPVTLIGGASGLLNNGNGGGRFLNVSDQGDRTHWRLGQCTDVQRVWSTIAHAAGTSVPWGGDVSTLSGIFTHV